MIYTFLNFYVFCYHFQEVKLHHMKIITVNHFLCKKNMKIEKIHILICFVHSNFVTWVQIHERCTRDQIFSKSKKFSMCVQHALLNIHFLMLLEELTHPKIPKNQVKYVRYIMWGISSLYKISLKKFVNMDPDRHVQT